MSLLIGTVALGHHDLELVLDPKMLGQIRGWKKKIQSDLSSVN